LYLSVVMGQNDIEARPASVANETRDLKEPIEVGRENLHTALPPHESYEGNHRFDPEAYWSVEEEKKVIRTTDIRLMTWLCVMVRFFSYLLSILLRDAYIMSSSLACNWAVVT
jgi:hypothetical protein